MKKIKAIAGVIGMGGLLFAPFTQASWMHSHTHGHAAQEYHQHVAAQKIHPVSRHVQTKRICRHGDCYAERHNKTH